MKTTHFLSTLFLVLLITGSGCSSLHMDSDPSPPRLVHGMPYYLPIGVITIKGTYVESTPKPVHSQTETTTESFSASSDIASKESVPGGPPSPSDSSTANSVTFTIDGWTITVTAEAEADATQPQYVIPQRNYLFEDDYRVTVNSKHLLNTGKTTAQDKSAEIGGAIASLVTSAASFSKERQVSSKVKDKEPFYISFHPTIQSEREAAQAILGSRDFTLEVGWVEGSISGGSSANLAKAEKYGLSFRLGVPFRISLNRLNEGTSRTEVLNYSKQFILPGTQTYVFDYRRMPFVKKVTDVGFTDGMLTDYHENLPSPILGALGIPKAILDALIPLPSSMTVGGASSAASAGQ